MRTVTATEASRNFSTLLDRVEQGETFAITRNGEEVARVGPPAQPNGAAVLAWAEKNTPDPDFADDIESMRELVLPPRIPWVDY